MANEHNNIFQKIIESLNQNQKLHQKKYHENDVINKIYKFYEISFGIF